MVTDALNYHIIIQLGVFYISSYISNASSTFDNPYNYFLFTLVRLQQLSSIFEALD